MNKINNLFNKYKLFNVFKNINKNNLFDYNVGKEGELLSGGQKQIIHIIRTILNDSFNLIILDEPTSAIDVENRDNILDLIMSLDKTIIIITHDEYIKKYCNNIINL